MQPTDLPYIIVSVIGAFTTFGAGMFATFKIMLKQGNTKDRDAATDRKDERKERILLAKSINRMAIATEKSALEAKVRNGHLGDQNVKLAQLVKGGNDEIIKQLKKNAVPVTRDSHNKPVAVRTSPVGAEENDSDNLKGSVK